MPLMKTLKLGNTTYTIPISGGGSGMSAEAVAALLDCFEHVAWVDGNGQTYYDALYDALTAEEPTPSATVTSISAVFTQGSNVVHEGDSLDTLKPYLTVTANYSDSTSGVVTNYTLSGTLTAGTSTITVSYGGKTTTFNVTVTQAATLSSISAVFTQGDNVIYNTDSLDTLKQYLVVTAHYDDSSTATVTAYTLSGTLAVGTSTITVSYGGKTTTFTVTVSERTFTAFGDIVKGQPERGNNKINVVSSQNNRATRNIYTSLSVGETVQLKDYSTYSFALGYQWTDMYNLNFISVNGSAWLSADYVVETASDTYVFLIKKNDGSNFTDGEITWLNSNFGRVG